MMRKMMAWAGSFALFVSMAQAAVVFDTTEGCVQLPVQGDVTGVKCFGDSSGNGSTSQNFSGSGSGTFSTSTLPFSYDFTVDGTRFVNVDSLGTSAVDWNANLYVKINGIIAGQKKLQGIFGQQTQGQFNVNTPNGQALTSWQIGIFASNTAKTKNKISLSIPQNSLNLPGTQVIPEPASVAFVAGGLLLMGLMGRRRARQ